MKRYLIISALLFGFLCPAAAFWQSRDSNYNVAVSGGATGWCSKIPQSGLVNCWPYDTANTTSGTATDVVGGKNATLVNVTLAGSGPSSNLNNAAVFNGTTSTGQTTLANVPTAAFSIVIWIKPVAATANPRIFTNDHTDSDNKGFQFRAGGSCAIDIGNGSTRSTATNFSSLVGGTWSMCTATYDGTNAIMYFNTNAGSSAAFTGPVAAGTNNAAFGFNPAYSGDFFNGNIAGTAIYNRALSSGEVTTINGL